MPHNNQRGKSKQKVLFRLGKKIVTPVHDSDLLLTVYCNYGHGVAGSLPPVLFYTPKSQVPTSGGFVVVATGFSVSSSESGYTPKTN